MANEDYKNNPLYNDITQLDHLSPQPTFSYEWNKASGRWEPAGGIKIDNIDLSIEPSDVETHRLLSGISGELSLSNDIETHRLLSGISGELSLSNDTETHRLLSGISGELSRSNDVETHRLLSGISGELSNININVEIDADLEAHRLLSGISGELSNIHIDVEIDSDRETHRLLSGVSGSLNDMSSELKGISGQLHEISEELVEGTEGISGELVEISEELVEGTHGISGELVGISGELVGISGKLVDIWHQIERRELYQPWKLRTKTVSQKIEEDFLLLESISDTKRYGIDSGNCYGENRSLMDDVFGTYFENGRKNKSLLETGHPDYFIHAEYTDPNRCVDSKFSFHTDTEFGMRQENKSASLINSYELIDFNDLYERGLVESVVIHNESSYPIQFHTSERRRDNSEPVSPKTEDLIYLDIDMAVKIENDEAGRIYVKRPHTISGFSIKYAVTYKETGLYDNF
jgi:hypothetical protein